MQLDDTLIQAFLNQKPIREQTTFWMITAFEEPDINRKDIVVELLQRLNTIVEKFPTFNANLWNALFSNQKDLIDTITIYPIVGSKDTMGRVEQQGDQIYIIIDLIQTANYTQIVSQMEYVLQNYITNEVAKLCIRADFPLIANDYLSLLNQNAFMFGLANFLSWGEDIEQYKFHTEKYEPHKERSFGILAHALEVNDTKTQTKLLYVIHNASFWDQFPSVAGMFYFTDTFKEYGLEGITKLYRKGPTSFIQIMFSS